MTLNDFLYAVAVNAVAGKDWAYCNMNGSFDETKQFLGVSCATDKGAVPVFYMNASNIVEDIKSITVPSIVVLEDFSTNPDEKRKQHNNISEVLLRGNYGASIIIPHNFQLKSAYGRRQAVENRIVWLSVD